MTSYCHVKRAIEEMHKSIKTEFPKKQFLYQNIEDDDDDHLVSFSFGDLLNEDPIHGLRWLKRSLKEAVEIHSNSDQKIKSHVMIKPSEEVKSLIKKPEIFGIFACESN